MAGNIILPIIPTLLKEFHEMSSNSVTEETLKRVLNTVSNAECYPCPSDYSQRITAYCTMNILLREACTCTRVETSEEFSWSNIHIIEQLIDYLLKHDVPCPSSEPRAIHPSLPHCPSLPSFLLENSVMTFVNIRKKFTTRVVVPQRPLSGCLLC